METRCHCSYLLVKRELVRYCLVGGPCKGLIDTHEWEKEFIYLRFYALSHTHLAYGTTASLMSSHIYPLLYPPLRTLSSSATLICPSSFCPVLHQIQLYISRESFKFSNRYTHSNIKHRTGRLHRQLMGKACGILSYDIV
jgi:hypothetical protein